MSVKGAEDIQVHSPLGTPSSNTAPAAICTSPLDLLHSGYELNHGRSHAWI